MIRKVLMLTAVVAAAGQANATGLMDSSLEEPRVVLLSEEQRDICNRDQIDPAELAWLRQSPDYDLILNQALANCPERALLLVEPATATTVQTATRENARDGKDGFRDVGGKDPKDKPKDKPKDPPDDPKDPPDEDCRSVECD